MARPTGSSAADVWSDGFEAASAETWAFEGEAGLERPRAVGVSVRHAHTVFDDVDRTIGQVIRDRRVVTAAGPLRAASGAVRLDEIARESGFASRDGPNRAFRQRNGMNTGEYHHGGHRDFE